MRILQKYDGQGTFTKVAAKHELQLRIAYPECGQNKLSSWQESVENRLITELNVSIQLHVV